VGGVKGGGRGVDCDARAAKALYRYPACIIPPSTLPPAQRKRTPLHLAAEGGHAGAVGALLEAGHAEAQLLAQDEVRPPPLPLPPMQVNRSTPRGSLLRNYWPGESHPFLPFCTRVSGRMKPLLGRDSRGNITSPRTPRMATQACPRTSGTSHHVATHAQDETAACLPLFLLHLWRIAHVTVIAPSLCHHTPLSIAGRGCFARAAQLLGRHVGIYTDYTGLD
jgi:hypothetical protein